MYEVKEQGELPQENEAVIRDREAAASGDYVVLRPIDFLRKLIARRVTIAIFVIVGTVLGLALALLTRPWYEARAVFLPPQKTDMITSPAAAAFLMQSQDSSDTYLGMLTSRTVADDVIGQMNLMKVYEANQHATARAKLGSLSKFGMDKNSLISVVVRADDPALAAGIANAYLSALYRLNGEMVASASSHRASFFETQLEQQKESLSQAEMELKNIQEKTGTVLPLGEAEAGLNTVMQLQSSIGSAEANLAALRQSETEDNSDVVRAKARLSELRAQLAHQQATSKATGPRVGLTSMGNLPGVSLEYLRKARELKLRETVYEALTQQYEKAKLSASDPGPQLQIVDRAEVPERKAGPPRSLLTVGGAVLGFLVGIAFAGSKDWFQRAFAALVG